MLEKKVRSIFMCTIANQNDYPAHFADHILLFCWFSSSLHSVTFPHLLHALWRAVTRRLPVSEFSVKG